MSFIAPTFRHPDQPVNALGYIRNDYEGALSTLCAGCGHDSISASVVQACFELAIEPHRVAKMSGIGCSSKTPAYFLKRSHGFNSVHGRMPSVTTGANLANRDLIYIGVSGDGDTASIGMGQYVHAVRRNLNMLYLLENNGCYGLTKGQDSATADKGSISKAGVPNTFINIDLCALALQLGAGFVARSFSGDKEQLVQLLKAAIAYDGFAFVDVISPCVTFNNTPNSTKGYDYAREHMEATGHYDFVPYEQEIEVSYEAGMTQQVRMHDGSSLYLQKTPTSHDPSDRLQALQAMHHQGEKILTGLLYLEEGQPSLHEILNTVEKPLRDLTREELCPGHESLQAINASLR